MSKQWYILHVYSGYEKKVKSFLDKMVTQELDGVLFDVKVPIEEVTVHKAGKKRNLKKNFFPGYILLEMDVPEDEHGWGRIASEIKSVNGVTGFLGYGEGKRPAPLEPDDVRRILEKMGEIKSAESRKVVQHDYQVNEHVRVVDGPFNNFNGVVEDIDDERGVVKVKVEIFGRSTPVELDFLQVEKV